MRLYEAEGLLASERAPNGYREFSPRAVVRVRNIRELLGLGFTISDVRTFVPHLDHELPPVFGDTAPCATSMRVGRERLATLRERIDALTALHDRIASRLGA
ncbi:MerR family transcriptional regulator [Cryptosporangium sp. NPDC048952]|uniref:MerR family transcriptional regulator n=1 Tax=Cryptosporangium sp. NPDC048952 TaxID=3363961 RepID=UPI00371A0B7B